jgi:tetratricopeptide (TPR) repeat protein
LLWLLLLAVAQNPAVRPEHDLESYLALVARYGSGERLPALREIRTWVSADVDAALARLRHEEGRLRAIPVAMGDIDFRLVEAAVLLHAESGLLFLQAQAEVDAGWHLRTSTSLFEWSHEAAKRLRERASRPSKPRLEPISPWNPAEPPAPALLVQERIAPRDFYLALAATSLTFGYARTAQEFAGQACEAAPLDTVVHLIAGSAAANVAEEHALRHRRSDAARAREEAEKAFRDALAIDPGLQEARLRLGKLHLDEGRLVEAEPLLAEVDARGGDDRQRYLARLFLGRVAERRGRPEEAIRLYGRALEAWPDSQAARLGLALALERSSGPAIPPVIVGATLGASRRLDRASDPWWVYSFGPPATAKEALDRLWDGVLGR